MGLHKGLIAGAAFNHSELNAALATATNLELFLKCPAVSTSFYTAALKVRFQSDGLVTCTLAEATAAADGTQRTPRNMNQLGTPPTSPMTVFFTPTTPAIVTTLRTGFAALSQDFCSECWMLKPSTNYLVRIANASGSNRAVAAHLEYVIVPNQDYLRGAWPGAGSY
jgi:hypothetical protein